jgi:FkbM family methyltransferase
MKLNNLSFNNQDYQIKIRSQADKSVMKEIFELGEYKDAESIIKSAKAPIIDAGAQAGFFSLYCRALNSEVQIYAIEPDENNLEVLDDNFEVNNILNVEIIPAALAGQTGLRDFYISSDTHNHSLFKVLTPRITKTSKIKTYSLDDFLNEQGIEKVSLLKLDIEGAEYKVLNNFSDWDKINNIIFEYHDFGEYKHPQLEKLLQEKGFKIKTTPSKFDKSLGFIIGSK